MAKATITGMSTYAESSKQAEAPTTEVAESVVSNQENGSGNAADNASVEGEITVSKELADAASEATKKEEKIAQKADDVFEIDLGNFENTDDSPESKENKENQSINWKDILKTIDKKEILKEIGISDFALGLDEYVKRGGAASDYIAANAIDWAKVSDLDIIKDEYKKKHPKLDDEKINKLISKKYSLGETLDDDEKEIGEIQLQMDGEELRQQRIKEQKNFKFPDPVQSQSQNNNSEAVEKQAEERKNFILQNEAVKSLLQSKRVAIQLGKDNSFNFDIKNPDVILQAMMPNSKVWQKLVSNDKGEPDVSKLIRIVKYAANMDAHDLAIFNYGKGIGHSIEIEEGQNAKKPTGRTVAPSSETLKDAFKTRAKMSTYGATA